MQGQRAVHHSWKSDSRYVCSKEKPGPRSLCFQAMKRSNSAHFSKAVSSLLKYLIERYCLTVGKTANPWKRRAEVKSLPLAGWPGCIGVFTVKPEQACGDARYLVSQLAVILKDQKKNDPKRVSRIILLSAPKRGCHLLSVEHCYACVVAASLQEDRNHLLLNTASSENTSPLMFVPKQYQQPWLWRYLI